MKSKERIASIAAQAVILMAVTAIIIVVAVSYKDSKKGEHLKADNSLKEFDLWYTEKEYEPYLYEAAKRYEEKTGIKVNLVYCTGIDYLENISEANKNGNGPDLFIGSEADMQKIVYLGLADQNYDDSVVNKENYLEKAISSITFNNKQYGYPLGFQTSVMAVNMAYTDTLPSTFDNIKVFADNFNSEESENSQSHANVENILKWDVKQIVFSYGFLGEYFNVGGEYGDDTKVLDVNSENAIKAGEYFYSLAQYFYMDIDGITYEGVLDDFLAGKIVFTIADGDIIKKLKESDANVELMTLPKLTEELDTRELSVTSVIFVNPFGDMKEEANDFAKFISYEMADEMYDITEKFISARKITYDNKYINSFVLAYEKSTGMPKLMCISDYWIKVGAVAEKIWNGSSVQETLASFQEELSQRMN